MPRTDRGSPGLAVAVENKLFLVDGGSGTLRQLAAAGLSYNDLDFILYTHFHPDHIGGLVPYLFATKYWPGFTRLEPVRIYGPTGLLELVGHLKKAFGRWIEPPDGRVAFLEVPADRPHEFDCGGIKVASAPTPHTEPSVGYRISGPDGRLLVVTGDTDYGPELLKLAEGADLLVTECSFPDDAKREGHLTPSLAGRAAREAGVKALALTHFYPEADRQSLGDFVKKEFDGPVTLAHDLMRLHV